MKSIKEVLQNALLVVISVALAIVALNVLFRAFAPHVVSQDVFPRALLNYLGDHYQTFYPAVNDKSLKNWNAVLGDSYAAGAGDAYLQNEKMYGWMHFLHETNGENYYIFGRSGFGSINAVREFIVTTDEIKNSMFYPKYQPPRRVLFLFYEGNDLNDNLRHYFQSGAGSKSVGDFVENEIARPVETGRTRRTNYPVIFLLRELFRDRWKFYGSPTQSEASPGEVKNHVIIKGKHYDFNILAQSAAAELTYEQTDLALDILFEALRHLKKVLPDTQIEIIYLPSMVTVYTWDNPVYVETYHTNDLVSITYQSNLERSKLLRAKIIDIANLEGIAFFDTTEELMSYGREVMLHGPRDLRHFNEIGQRIVADAIYREEAALRKEAGR